MRLVVMERITKSGVTAMQNRLSCFLVAALTLLFPVGPVDAFMFRLGGMSESGPFLGQSAIAVDDASTLYALDNDGREVVLAKVGDHSIDGLPIADLGFPSVADDGTVFFAAGAFEQGNLSWRMFSARAGSGEPPVQLKTTEIGSEIPEMRVDPRPMPDGRGGIVFVGPDDDGEDAIFSFNHGHLATIVRTGSETTDGRIIRRITFGTIDPAGENIAFVGWLDRGGQALLLASSRAVTVLATEKSKAPDGGDFLANGLGRPAAVRAGKQTLVAFPASTTRGDELFLYRDGKLKRVLAAQQSCENGKLTYVSPDRPALLADGTIGTLGTCASTQVLMTIDSRGASRVVIEGGESPHRFVNFGNPVLENSGAIVFRGGEDDGSSHLYSLVPGQLPNQIAPSPNYQQVSSVKRPHPAHIEMFAVGRFGHLAYLGGK
jgi:hypothetical protein